MRTGLLSVGEPAPWFHCRTATRRNFAFDTVAGRHVVLCFFDSSTDPAAARLLAAVRAGRKRFDDHQLSFFGVSSDPDDERLKRLTDSAPGIRFIWDFDDALGGMFGLKRADGTRRKATYVLDPRLRVLAVMRFGEDPDLHAARLFELLDRLPGIPPPAVAMEQAPILVVPRVFEPALCRRLVREYETRGGYDSGFMREVDGRTVPIVDHAHKRRRDCQIDDPQLRQACMHRLHDRLVPEIRKAFQFQATRMERHIVACYDAGERGHFRPHRDDTTKGTAHRRFAVSLFLNTGRYEGGHLRFPEFGPQLYTAPLGGAVVFSCSLLHEATPVTRGRRFMYLPFLYDDAAADIRVRNYSYVGDPAAEDDGL